MAVGITPNLTGISDRGLGMAYMAGVAQASQDLGWGRFFPWDRAQFTAQGFAPPSGYSSVGVTEDGDIATEAVEETYQASIDVAIYRLGYALSGLAYATTPREMLMQLYSNLGAQGVRFFSALLASIINEATTDSGPDGVSLANANHPLGAGVHSNYANTSLGFTSFATAVRMLRSQVNHRGAVCGYQPTRLLLPNAQDVVGAQVVTGKYASNDLSNENVYQGIQLTRTIVPEFSSTTRWALLDERVTTFLVPIVRGQNPWVVERHPDNGKYIVRDEIFAGKGYADWRGVVIG